jgi:Protein of unknown function (DUF3570)
MKIKEKLALASCALLQPVSANAAGEAWLVDAELLVYSESDGRVSVLEPVANLSVNFEDESSLSVKVVIDAMTGATPNGAHASSVAQTFTRPSGSGEFMVAAGDVPLDDTFHDTRLALSADWMQPVIDDTTRLALGANVSGEFDYFSLGVSATLLRDFNDRNTTLSAGVGLNSDTITPKGGIPDPLKNMTSAGTPTNRVGDSDTKSTIDLLLGLTQVIDRRTLMQFNYTIGKVDGYQNDPYKIVPVIDPVTGLPIAQSGNNLPYLYENRPDTRTRQALFWQTVHHLSEDVIRFSYRHYWDDWGINSDTLELKYRYTLGAHDYIQPRLRYYTQTAADFYAHSLYDGIQLPQYVTADYRQGEFDSITAGLRYGHAFDKRSELTFRFDLMQQNSKVVGTLVGDQLSQDVAPDLSAIIASVGYSVRW